MYFVLCFIKFSRFLRAFLYGSKDLSMLPHLMQLYLCLKFRMEDAGGSRIQRVKKIQEVCKAQKVEK